MAVQGWQQLHSLEVVSSIGELKGEPFLANLTHHLSVWVRVLLREVLASFLFDGVSVDGHRACALFFRPLGGSRGLCRNALCTPSRIGGFVIGEFKWRLLLRKDAPLLIDR